MAQNDLPGLTARGCKLLRSKGQVQRGLVAPDLHLTLSFTKLRLFSFGDEALVTARAASAA